MKSQKIKDIRKKFHNEWLLIGVDKVKNSRPVSGWLIDHSPDRDTIFKEITKYNSRYSVFATYSQDNLPKGYAAAFILHV